MCLFACFTIVCITRSTGEVRCLACLKQPWPSVGAATCAVAAHTGDVHCRHGDRRLRPGSDSRLSPFVCRLVLNSLCSDFVFLFCLSLHYVISTYVSRFGMVFTKLSIFYEYMLHAASLHCMVFPSTFCYASALHLGR